MQCNTTEATNARSAQIDMLSAAEIFELMNSEDALIAAAVHREKSSIASAIEQIAAALRAGGRLFYLGAGTSGRLGVLDASECPPTFNTPPEWVVGIIAGGSPALTRAIEGAEDDSTQAAIDLQQHRFSNKDILVGIATSGSTPYVIGGLQYARKIGATCVGLCCNANSVMQTHADLVIAPIVGPEVVSGSTRLKAGTATKMVLNMLTTGAMILIGKTYGNFMVDLRASNSKLQLRSIRIVAAIAGVDGTRAEHLLAHCQGEVKTAIVCQLLGVEPELARQRLAKADGKLRAALDSAMQLDPRKQ